MGDLELIWKVADKLGTLTAFVIFVGGLVKGTWVMGRECRTLLARVEKAEARAEKAEEMADRAQRMLDGFLSLQRQAIHTTERAVTALREKDAL